MEDYPACPIHHGQLNVFGKCEQCLTEARKKREDEKRCPALTSRGKRCKMPRPCPYHLESSTWSR